MNLPMTLIKMEQKITLKEVKGRGPTENNIQDKLILSGCQFVLKA